MFVLKTFLIVYAIFSIGDAKFEDSLKKCSINDDECLKSLSQNIVKGAKYGIPEMGVPPLAPLTVDDVTVNVLDTVTGTLADGEIRGIDNCIFSKFQIDIRKKITTQEMTCDIAIQGTLEMTGKNPIIQSVLKTVSVDAYGKGGIKIDKLSLKFKIPFDLYKKDDGKIYLKLDDQDIKYQYNIQDVHFWADKITIGDDDISETGVAYLNKNWRVIMDSFGNIFLDTSVPVYAKLANPVLWYSPHEQLHYRRFVILCLKLICISICGCIYITIF